MGAAMAFASPALAQGTAPQPRAASDGGQAAGSDKKVCRVTKRTGSRLSARRTCRTQAEWMLLDRDGSRDAKEFTDGYMKPPPEG
jgi:hypothetical protein